MTDFVDLAKLWIGCDNLARAGASVLVVVQQSENWGLNGGVEYW